MQQDHLVANLAADLAVISLENLSTVLGYLYQASPQLGERVARQIQPQSEG
nr:catalase-related domain-containing protein [Paenibacillus protaetiae]